MTDENWITIDGGPVSYYEYDLLEAAQELHCYITGASDCINPLVALRLRSFIEERLLSWSASIPRAKGFDEAVKKLLQAALAEYYEQQIGKDTDTVAENPELCKRWREEIQSRRERGGGLQWNTTTALLRPLRQSPGA